MCNKEFEILHVFLAVCGEVNQKKEKNERARAGGGGAAAIYDG